MTSPDVTLTSSRNEVIQYLRGPRNEALDAHSGLEARFYREVPRFTDPPALNYRTSFQTLLIDTVKILLKSVKLTPYGIPEPRYVIHKKLPGENGWAISTATNILQKATDCRILFLEVTIDPWKLDTPEDWYKHSNRKRYVQFVYFGFRPDEIYLEILGENKNVSPTLKYLIRSKHFIKVSTQSYGSFRRLWRDLCGNVTARSFLTMEELVKFNNHRLPRTRRDLEALSLCLFGRSIFPYDGDADWNRRFPLKIYNEKNEKVNISIDPPKISKAEAGLRRKKVIFKTDSAYFDVFICNCFTTLFSVYFCQCEVFLHSTRGKNWLKDKNFHSLGHMIFEIGELMFAYVCEEGKISQPLIGKYREDDRGEVDFGVNKQRDDETGIESAEPLFSSRESSLISGPVVRRNVERTTRTNVNYDESSSQESEGQTFTRELQESLEEIREQEQESEVAEMYKGNKKFLRSPKQS